MYEVFLSLQLKIELEGKARLWLIDHAQTYTLVSKFTMRDLFLYWTGAFPAASLSYTFQYQNIHPRQRRQLRAESLSFLQVAVDARLKNPDIEAVPVIDLVPATHNPGNWKLCRPSTSFRQCIKLFKTMFAASGLFAAWDEGFTPTPAL